MDNKELIDFSKQLVDNALMKKYHHVEILKSFSGYLGAAYLYKAEKKLIASFTRIKKASYNNYIKNLQEGVDDVQLLINCKTYEQCADFYKADCKILKKAISEYLVYLFGGRLLEALIYDTRNESDCFNFITGELPNE